MPIAAVKLRKKDQHVAASYVRVRLTESKLSQALTAGDGAAVSEESAFLLTATTPAEVMLFDLA